MARKKRPLQAFANPASNKIPDVSMDLGSLDALIRSQSVKLKHFMAMVSPIGKKSRGDYRRPDQYDDVSSNGFLYKEVGCFPAVMTSNSRHKQDLDGGSMDNSTCFISLPRFYIGEDDEFLDKRIYLAPGDKVYLANPEVDVRVINYQEVEYTVTDNVLQFPVDSVQMLVDSRNQSYECGTDFVVTNDGNIRWIGKNPGIDPDTGKGRVYSIRYLYTAHWYVVSIPNEVRIGQVTENGVRSEQRYPYNAQLVREYVYHSRRNGDEKPPKEFDEGPTRETRAPIEPVLPQPFIKINMDDIEDDD